MADGPGARPDPAAGQTRVTGDPDSDDAIGTQASHWFAVMRGPDAEARRPEFEAWRASDIRRARAYEEVADLFEISAGATRTADDRGSSAISSAVQGRPSRTGRFAIAAGVAAMIAVGTFTWMRAPSTHDVSAPTVIASNVPDAPARVHRLGDGSLVLLGAASLVTANLSTVVREITLDKGRARFIVAHDPARDFVVISQGRTITARDAVFDVTVTTDTTYLSVVTGAVEVLASGGAGVRTIAAGENLVLGENGPAATASATAATGWPPTRTEFDAMPLADVVRLANGIGKPPIVLASKSLEALRLTGTFDIRDTASLARKIAAALDLDIEAGPSEIRLAPRR